MQTHAPKDAAAAGWPYPPAQPPQEPPFETGVEMEGETDAYRVEREAASVGRWPWPTSASAAGRSRKR